MTYNSYMVSTGTENIKHVNIVSSDFSDRKSGTDVLSIWQNERLLLDRRIAQWAKGDARVTLLTYYFWAEDPGERHLDALECAILETWRHCGRMKTVIVTDRTTPQLKALASNHPGFVEVQIEPTLQPGNLYSMSVDCNSRLHRRFSTDYVLIIQDDGFPLRAGLDEYLGKFDFIGAPYVRNRWYLQMMCRALKCQVCNGGFSLRSHKICELASRYWERKYHAFPDCDHVSEDYFYTKTLPIREPSYRRQITMPSFEEASDFSYDAVFPYSGRRLPFGFHGALAFKLIYDSGILSRTP